MEREHEPSALQGLRVLVVEDVAMLAWRLTAVLVAAGAEVAGPVPDVARALALLDQGEVDAAVLDMNLDGETAEPIADVLAARKVPFLFLTGYAWGDMEGRHAARPALGKPLKPAALIRLLADLAANRPTADAVTPSS